MTLIVDLNEDLTCMNGILHPLIFWKPKFFGFHDINRSLEAAICHY